MNINGNVSIVINIIPINTNTTNAYIPILFNNSVLFSVDIFIFTQIHED